MTGETFPWVSGDLEVPRVDLENDIGGYDGVKKRIREDWLELLLGRAREGDLGARGSVLGVEQGELQLASGQQRPGRVQKGAQLDRRRVAPATHLAISYGKLIGLYLGS